MLLGWGSLAGCGGAPDDSATTAPTETAESRVPADFEPPKPPQLPPPDPTTSIPRPSPGLQTAEALAARAEELDRTLWAPEVVAQQYERRIARLWDELRGSRDPYVTLTELPVERIRVGGKIAAREIEGTIRRTDYGVAPAVPAREIEAGAWRTWMLRFRDRGFRIMQSEWLHHRFTPPSPGQPARSEVAFELHLAHTTRQHTLVLKGTLGVEWTTPTGAPSPSAASEPQPRIVDATKLTLVERQGAYPFKPAIKIEPEPATPVAPVELAPLIVHDVTGDGLPEIILGGCGALMLNQGGFRFERRELFAKPGSLHNTGVVADFTGDGRDDLFGVDYEGRVVLAPGQAGPDYFFAPPAPCSRETIKGPSAVTAGDIDGDGDLDVWLTQYIPPYTGGQMPTPFYDARDGYPSVLLLNDGRGQFTDGTAAAGLTANRLRRTYSTSLVDLDDDGDLDLLVVSDFSGIDIYANDGRGKFTDVTRETVSDRLGFGMAHALGDFDRDGKLDLYFVGMTSAAANRLETLGLAHPDFPDVAAHRREMVYGNRLLLRREKKFVQTELSQSTAVGGWAWGAAACDFDNDGDDDLYVANGQISGRSVRNYDARYWCHDVYAGGSQPDPEVARFLTDLYRPAEWRGLGEGAISWDGYQHNKLFLNLDGQDFLDVAPLVGVAYEFDGRGVVAADLDADGRGDLLVVATHWATPVKQVVPRQSLYVLRNELEPARPWIGARLVATTSGVSPVGAKVTLRGPFGTRERRIVTGDSYYAQHPATAHFGLGKDTPLESLEVRWPSGKTTTIAKPKPNEYHVLKP